MPALESRQERAIKRVVGGNGTDSVRRWVSTKLSIFRQRVHRGCALAGYIHFLPLILWVLAAQSTGESLAPSGSQGDEKSPDDDDPLLDGLNGRESSLELRYLNRFTNRRGS